jgi:glutamyl-tRNA reductase
MSPLLAQECLAGAAPADAWASSAATLGPAKRADAEPHSASAASPDEGALVCIGVSFRTAGLALRERLALAPSAASALLARFGCGRETRPAGVSELVILSTCNRLELYAAGGDCGAETLVGMIADATGVSAAELRPALYTLSGREAVRHLCRTAAGLDSMVIGESQILGQVASAYSAAIGHGAAGHMMATLFSGAIRAGRRARAETAINRNPATVSSVAVKLVGDALGDLARASVLVIGSGEMAELAVSALRHRGAADICVISRTREHADRLSARFGGRAMAFERLQDALTEADVVIASTAAPHQVVTRDMVVAAMSCRPNRPLAIVDIAVPRNVEPSVASVSGVTYHDLDDLQRHVAENLVERASEIPRVEALVDEEAADCAAGLRQLDVLPLIADLRTHTDEVRRSALERARRRFAHLSEDDRASIEAFSESLVNRLFHEPMVTLRREAQDGQVAGYAMALRHLFGLER